MHPCCQYRKDTSKQFQQKKNRNSLVCAILVLQMDDIRRGEVDRIGLLLHLSMSMSLVGFIRTAARLR